MRSQTIVPRNSEMSDGLKIRAEIDTENAKGLLLINGGSATALLAFLTQIFGNAEFIPFARFVLWALAAFLLGLALAVIHNSLRRSCSLVYERHDFRPPAGKLFGRTLSEPSVCFWSKIFLILSVAAFCTGGFLVVFGGFKFVNSRSTATPVTPTTSNTPPAADSQKAPQSTGAQR